MLLIVEANETHQQVINIINSVTGALSLVGCIWLFYFYFKASQQHPLSLKLILALSTSDFIFSIANLFAAIDNRDDALCTIQGVIRTFATIASLYFAAFIAIWANYIFSKGCNQDPQHRSFFIKIMIMGFVVPAIFTIMPIILRDYFRYGSQAYGCTIVPISDEPIESERRIIVVIFLAIPMIVAFSATIVAYIQIAKKWKNVAKSFLPENNDIAVYKLFLYPVMLFISYSPSILDDTLSVYYPSSNLTYALNIMHVTLCHSVGFSNAFVYGYLKRKHYLVKDETPPVRSNSSSP